MFRRINKKYLAIFLTVAACIVFYFLLLNASSVWNAIGWLFNVFTPVLIGFVIAYLLDPVLKYCERFFRWISRKKPLKKKPVRVLSMIVTYLFAAALVASFAMVIVPQLVNSVKDFATNFTNYANQLASGVNGIIDRLSDPKYPPAIANTISNVLQEGEKWLSDKVGEIIAAIPEKAVSSIPELISIVFRVAVGIKDFIIGFFLSIYMLYDKEMLMARMKKVALALFRKKNGDRVILFFRDTDESVGSFINSKILDSIVIGLATYVILLIARIPYAALIALVVGVTNIIPVFGPIIGAIPGAVLLLFVAPTKIPLYILLIIIIQQVDGNVIGPKIIGRATGVSDFWVLVSLTVAGAVFGLWGMVLAVPVFSMIYRLARIAVNRALAEEGMETNSELYVDYPPRKTDPDSPRERRKTFFARLFRRRKKKKKESEPSAPEEKDAANEPEKKEEGREDL